MNIQRWVLLISAFVGLGMSMPSCPGQQELKDQVTALQQTNDNLAKRIQAGDTRIKSLTDDMDKVKPLLQQMANAIQAQKGAMDQLDANLKEIQTKMTAAAARKPVPAASAKGKKRR